MRKFTNLLLRTMVLLPSPPTPPSLYQVGGESVYCTDDLNAGEWLVVHPKLREQFTIALQIICFPSHIEHFICPKLGTRCVLPRKNHPSLDPWDCHYDDLSNCYWLREERILVGFHEIRRCLQFRVVFGA